jgi:hypothetical protein
MAEANIENLQFVHAALQRVEPVGMACSDVIIDTPTSNLDHVNIE